MQTSAVAFSGDWRKSSSPYHLCHPHNSKTLLGLLFPATVECLDGQSLGALNATAHMGSVLPRKVNWPKDLPLTPESIKTLPAGTVELDLTHAQSPSIEDWVRSLNLICEMFGSQLTAFTLKFPPSPQAFSLFATIQQLPCLEDLSVEVELPHLLHEEAWSILGGLQKLTRLSLKSEKVFVRLEEPGKPPFYGGTWEEIEAKEGVRPSPFFPALFEQLAVVLIPLLQANPQLSALELDPRLCVDAQLWKTIVDNIGGSHLRELAVYAHGLTAEDFQSRVPLLQNVEVLYAPTGEKNYDSERDYERDYDYDYESAPVLRAYSDVLPELKQLHKLRKLSWRRTNFYSDCLHPILEANRMLEVLSFTECPSLRSEELSIALAVTTPHLTSLHIDRCLKFADLVHREGQPAFLRLKAGTFDLFLTNLPGLQRLKYLSIKGYDQIDPHAIKSIGLWVRSGKLPVLRQIELGQIQGVAREIRGENPYQLQWELQILLEEIGYSDLSPSFKGFWNKQDYQELRRGVFSRSIFIPHKGRKKDDAESGSEHWASDSGFYETEDEEEEERRKEAKRKRLASPSKVPSELPLFSLERILAYPIF